MNKYSVDYSELSNKLSRPKHYNYNDVKDKLVKVAFDVVRFMDSEDIDGLWQIQNTDDGDVIVAMYEKTEEKKDAGWKAVADKTAENINVFYKGTPVTKISLASLGTPKQDAEIMCRSISGLLTKSAEFLNSMLEDLSEEERNELYKTYPEIRTQI